MKKLAIAIPTYNEKENLVGLIEKIQDVLRSIPVLTTIIIIDDNSEDKTGEIADNLARKYNKIPFQVVVIHRPGKMGLASAYIRAFSSALKKDFDHFLSMDADFSHNPKYIPEMLKAGQDNDLIIASRNIKGGSVTGWEFVRKVISKGGSLYARSVLQVNIKDLTGGFNLYSRKALETINLENIKSEGYSFQIEMKYKIVKSGLKYIEIPIVFENRKKGKSKMSSKIMLEAAFRVWQIKFNN